MSTTDEILQLIGAHARADAEQHARLEARLDVLAEQQTQIRIDIAGLKVKSGVWGLIGGAIPVIVGLSMWLLTGSS